MRNTEGLTELLEKIKKQLLLPKGVLLGIDGANGAGKTSLAEKIIEYLPAAIIHIDDFLEKNQGSYLDYIRYGDIEKALIEWRRQGGGLCIIEGVCLLEVVNKIHFEPDFLIYIKLYNGTGDWVDASVCDISISLNNILHSIDTAENRPGIGNFDRELARYHHKYHPIEKADWIFSRVED
jgi:hypothetical protein